MTGFDRASPVPAGCLRGPRPGRAFSLSPPGTAEPALAITALTVGTLGCRGPRLGCGDALMAGRGFQVTASTMGQGNPAHLSEGRWYRYGGSKSSRTPRRK